jgi:hypothetical protein
LADNQLGNLFSVAEAVVIESQLVAAAAAI